MAEALEGKSCRISIVTALAENACWYHDVPPAGGFGDAALDAALADAFRMMLFLDTNAERFGFIERRLRSPEGPGGTCSPYQAELARWWLDLFHAEQGCATCHGAGVVSSGHGGALVPCPDCQPRAPTAPGAHAAAPLLREFA